MISEPKAVRLFRAITDIGDDLVEDAEAPPAGAKRPAWRRWGALAACLCLSALAGAGVWRWMGQFDDPITPDLPSATANTQIADDPIPDQPPNDFGAGSTLPSRITPVLRVNGTLYRYTGMSAELFLDPSGSYCVMGDGSTYLPEGYEPCGEIGGVTAQEPAEDFQLQAGFEASGTVFASREHPAVVYALLHTDWSPQGGAFVRFVSEELGDNELLTWQGRTYRFSIGTGLSELVEELPEGCELVGKLRFVGDDSIPAGDLETNCRGDSYAKPLEGREVYAVPGDDSALYLYEHHYWAQGDYPAWRVCHLWEQ